MALVFDGTANATLLSSAACSITETSGVSAAFWYKTTDTGTQRLFGVSDSGTTGDWEQLVFSLNASNTPVAFDVPEECWIYYRDYDGHVLDAEFSIANCNDGNWHHYVWTYDGTNNHQLYYDGVLQTPTYRIRNQPSHGLSFTHKLGIGDWYANGSFDGTYPANGSMAEFSLYDTQVNAAWVNRLMNHPLYLMKTGTSTDYNLPMEMGYQNYGSSGQTFTAGSGVSVDNDHPFDGQYPTNILAFPQVSQRDYTSTSVEMATQVSTPTAVAIDAGFAVGSEAWWAYRRKQYRSRLRKGWWEEFPELKKRQRKLKNKSRRISLRGTKLR